VPVFHCKRRARRADRPNSLLMSHLEKIWRGAFRECVPGWERIAFPDRHAAPAKLLIACLLLATCGDTADPGRASINVVAGEGQTVIAGAAVPLDPVVEVRDAAGRPAAGVPVRFSVTEGGGVALDTLVQTAASGRASTPWILGASPGPEHRLRATAGANTVEIRATAIAPQAGQQYVGRNGYIEYRPGELPIVITAPHGGTMEPDEIPDRTTGVATRDTNTDALAIAISDAFQARTGKRPHIVICRLHRSKLDANREIVEAAQGNRLAQRAWFEFQLFTEAASHVVAGTYGKGFYIDLHGHGHPIPRLELGYTLTAEELALADAALEALANQSSIRSLASRSTSPFVALLRGDESLGTLFEAQGFPAVPSKSQPHPDGAPYFSGGYNTERHGSRNGGMIDGVQIETHSVGVRDTPVNRQRFASALVDVLMTFFVRQYGL
jgi:hypothetical protein